MSAPNSGCETSERTTERRSSPGRWDNGRATRDEPASDGGSRADNGRGSPHDRRFTVFLRLGFQRLVGLARFGLTSSLGCELGSRKRLTREGRKRVHERIEMPTLARVSLRDRVDKLRRGGESPSLDVEPSPFGDFSIVAPAAVRIPGRAKKRLQVDVRIVRREGDDGIGRGARRARRARRRLRSTAREKPHDAYGSQRIQPGAIGLRCHVAP